MTRPAAVMAFGYSLPAGFAIFLIVSVAQASALAPIVPIADATRCGGVRVCLCGVPIFF